MTNWPDIVNRHGDIVWSTVYRLVSNRADASDCFQDTFLSALELSRKEKIRNWPAVLKGIAVRRALDRLRQRYKESVRFEPLSPEPGVDAKAPEPANEAASTELAERLRLALAELDATQAHVFSLVCLFDHSYAETGKLLDLTANHVGVVLNRAKAALRERLAAFAPPAPVESLERRKAL